MEQSLVLIKPDGVQRGLIGEIISRFERCGLRIIAMKMVYADEEIAGKHYADDEQWLCSVGRKASKSAGETISDNDALAAGHKVRRMLMDYISMSPVVALAIEGHHAVAKIRTLVGGTSPHEQPPGTIRGDYSFDSYALADVKGRPLQNLIHASDSPEEGKREIGIWFEDTELHAWERVDDHLMYRVNDHVQDH